MYNRFMKKHKFKLSPFTKNMSRAFKVSCLVVLPWVALTCYFPIWGFILLIIGGAWFYNLEPKADVDADLRVSNEMIEKELKETVKETDILPLADDQHTIELEPPKPKQSVSQWIQYP